MDHIRVLWVVDLFLGMSNICWVCTGWNEAIIMHKQFVFGLIAMTNNFTSIVSTMSIVVATAIIAIIRTTTTIVSTIISTIVCAFVVIPGYHWGTAP